MLIFLQFLKSQKSGILGISKIKWNFEKFLVDKHGKVVQRYSSISTPAGIKPEVEKLLKNWDFSVCCFFGYLNFTVFNTIFVLYCVTILKIGPKLRVALVVFAVVCVVFCCCGVCYSAMRLQLFISWYYCTQLSCLLALLLLLSRGSLAWGRWSRNQESKKKK